jgi:hypothetical protein
MTAVILGAACPAPQNREDPLSAPGSAVTPAGARGDAATAMPSDAAPDAALDAGIAAIPWQKLRTRYEAFQRTAPGSRPCDWRVKGQWPPGARCPASPGILAAKVRHVTSKREGTAMIEVDYGREDGITSHWTGALLDDDGRVASPWGTIEPFARDRSFLTLGVPWATVVPGQHAVLRSDHDPDPRGELPFPYPEP